MRIKWDLELTDEDQAINQSSTRKFRVSGLVADVNTGISEFETMLSREVLKQTHKYTNPLSVVDIVKSRISGAIFRQYNA